MLEPNLAYALRFITFLITIALGSIACSGATTPPPTAISSIIEHKENEAPSADSQIIEHKEIEAPPADSVIGEHGENDAPPSNFQSDKTINPRISIEPSAGPTGTLHTLQLVDFTPNSLVDIYTYYLATGELVLSFQVEVDNAGHALAGIISEQGDDIGGYRVVASDQATGLFVESSFFTEQAPAAISPKINMSPNAGPIGTVHTLELVDFTPSGLVDINAFYLATGDLVLSFQIEVDKTGYVLTGIISEQGDDIGEYRVVASDQATGLSDESTIVIEQAVATLSVQIRIDPGTVDFTPGEDTGTKPLYDFVWIGDDKWTKVVLQNSGSVPIVIASHEFTSPNPGDFHLGESFLGARLSPQQSCYILLVFEPAGIGERQSNLVIRSNETGDGIAKTEVALHGYAKVNTVGLASTASALTGLSIPDCDELVY